MMHITKNQLTRATARRLALLLASALLVPAISGCKQEDQGHATSMAEARHIKAQIATVQMQSLPVLARFPGSVITADQVGISSRITGYVRSIEVHEGETVKKGQVLLTIDPTDVVGGIDQAKAGLAKARAALSDAKANYERFKSLYAQNAVPKQRFEQMETAYRVAQSNYTAAQAALKQARAQLDYAKIRAPFSGTITSRTVDPGQLAYPSHPLLMLQSGGHRQIQVQVNDQAYATLKPDQDVRVIYTSADGQKREFTGEVERMVAAADPVTHTHTVKIGVPDTVNLPSGNFVTVVVPVAEKQGIKLPASAIHDRAGLIGVFVVDKADKAWFRLVRTAGLSGDHHIVLAGLDQGERVVISASDRLENGVIIDPVTTDQQGQP